MSDNKLNFTPREYEILALAWQCFQTDPKVDINKLELAALTGGKHYTHSSASTTLGKLRARMKQYAQNFSEDNPTPLKQKGKPRKKRAADDAENGDEGKAPKPKKRAKKATKGPELTGEADKMMGLGGAESAQAKKVKDEPEDMGCSWGANGDEAEEEV